jgi:hypothetical protein
VEEKLKLYLKFEASQWSWKVFVRGLNEFVSKRESDPTVELNSGESDSGGGRWDLKDSGEIEWEWNITLSQ